jgi:branched-chain amino acid transport system ATP-binding protein
VALAPSIDAPFPAGDGREGASAAVLCTESLTVRFGGLTSRFRNCARRNPRHHRTERAGKSTFFNCLTGVLRPSTGRILFNGEDITGLSPNRVSQKGIARSYQITNILPNATTLENVRIAAQSRRPPSRPSVS